MEDGKHEIFFASFLDKMLHVSYIWRFHKAIFGTKVGLFIICKQRKPFSEPRDGEIVI